MLHKCKIIILGVHLLASLTNQAAFDLKTLVAEFKSAYNDIDFFIKKGMITVHKDVVYDANYMYTNYMYNFSHILARQSYDEYQKLLQALNRELILNSSNNGIILGIIIACVNKATGHEKTDKKAVIGLLTSIAGMLLHQNQQIGTVPYYASPDLKHKNNLLFSFDSLSMRALSGLTCAAISYFGTSCILERLDRFRNNKPKEKIQTLQV